MKKVFFAFFQCLFDLRSAAGFYKSHEAIANNTNEYDCMEMKEETTEGLYLQWWRSITSEPVF
jgi:hypothetical protein